MTIVKKHVEKRIENLKKKMIEFDLDNVIIARPENVFYFSNFNPIISSHPVFVIISLKKETSLLVHCIRNDHAREEGSIDNIQLYGKWGDNVALALDPFDAIKALVGDSSIKLGVEADFVSINWIEKVKERLNIEKIKDVSGEVNMLRIIKDSYEIDCMRKAAALTDCGVKTAVESLNKGLHEALACTEGQYAMRKMWHEKFQEYEVAGFGSSESAQIDSLVVWSMANERIAYGCDCPIAYTPKEGDLVLPMSWARIGGYTAENERSVIVGETSELRNRAYDSMLKARENIFSILKPGVLFEDLYFTAMKVFEDNGFGNILPGRCGHGMGLSSHEFPSLTKGNKIPLEPGMIFTVEPGLMAKEWGGVRHSDTVLVTEDGYESLTKYRNDRFIIKKK